MSINKLEMCLDTVSWVEEELNSVTRKIEDMFYEIRLLRDMLNESIDEAESELTDDELLLSQVPLGDGSV